jgi:hypothetical protein
MRGRKTEKMKAKTKISAKPPKANSQMARRFKSQTKFSTNQTQASVSSLKPRRNPSTHPSPKSSRPNKRTKRTTAYSTSTTL